MPFAVKGGMPRYPADLHSKGSIMAQDKEPVTSVVQGRLLKILETKKRMKQADAIWLQKHATPDDLRAFADAIDQRAKTPDEG